MQRLFKLETYVGKLLMTYLNNYVHLRDEHVAMSLWEGDVILNHVELRCDVLEGLIPFPVGFRSGQVHELRIHVPWTKLNSENIVVTLNTVDCNIILKKRDHIPSNIQPVDFSVEDISPSTKIQQTTDSPGYLKSYLNSLLTNIRLEVHNLNVKFLQDDIVLSMSCDHVEFSPTDSNWRPSLFTENMNATYRIHRKLSISDATFCLDHCASSGFVETYEAPFAYRIQLSCLVELVYSPECSATFGSFAAVSTFNIHAQKLNLCFSPRQLHALIRLLHVIVAVHTGTVDWASIMPQNLSDGTSNDSSKPTSSVDDEADANVNEGQESWASWMWSFVPSILPATDNLSDSDEELLENVDIVDRKEAAFRMLQLIYEAAESNSQVPTVMRNISSLSDMFGVSGQVDFLKSATSSVTPSGSETTTANPSVDPHSRIRRRCIRYLNRHIKASPLLVFGIFVDELTFEFTVSS